MNGMTGEMEEGLTFIGVVNYQRLKHLAGDSLHARGTGNKSVKIFLVFSKLKPSISTQ